MSAHLHQPLTILDSIIKDSGAPQSVDCNVFHFQQMKLATGAQDVQRRLIRSAETTTSKFEEETTTEMEEGMTTMRNPESETQADWSLQR